MLKRKKRHIEPISPDHEEVSDLPIPIPGPEEVSNDTVPLPDPKKKLDEER